MGISFNSCSAAQQRPADSNTASALAQAKGEADQRLRRFEDERQLTAQGSAGEMAVFFHRARNL